jgi:hypothetical protein
VRTAGSWSFERSRPRLRVAEAAAPRSHPASLALSRSLRRVATEAVGWPLGVATLCFTLTVARLQTTADSYLDLVSGRLIVAHGLPHADTLSIVGHGRTWVDQQWLAQVAMYGIWRLAGTVGLGFLLALLLALAFGLLTHLCIGLGAPPQRATVWVLLAFLGSVGYTALRAEMFSYVAFVLTLTLLARDTRRQEFELSFLWIFLLLGVWANLHGAVVLGSVLVFCYCLARAGGASLARRPRTALLYVASAVATVACVFATPYGLSEAHYYHGVFSSSLLREYENEWTSPRLSYLPDLMTFAFALAVVVVAGLALRKRFRPNLVLLLATVVTGGLAFHAIRYQPWFAIAGAAFAAVTLGAVRPAPARLDPRVLRLALTAAAAVASIAALSAARGHLDRRETALARGALATAADWQSRHPAARILADQNTSDRLLWWYPATAGHVAFDLRLDFYEPESVREWFSYVFGPKIMPIRGSAYDVYLASSANASLYLKLRNARCLTTLYADRYGIAAARSASLTDCAS